MQKNALYIVNGDWSPLLVIKAIDTFCVTFLLCPLVKYVMILAIDYSCTMRLGVHRTAYRSRLHRDTIAHFDFMLKAGTYIVKKF